MKLDKPLLVFDHDGTLHDSMYICEPAMKYTVDWLRERGCRNMPYLTSEQIARGLGMTAHDIWNMYAPDMDEELIKESSDICGKEMGRILLTGEARWYEGASDMLSALKAEGYHMVILSNCDIRLRDFYWDYFKMDTWFDKFYDSESYGQLPKTGIIKIILNEDYEGSRGIMIGDREKDFDCAKAAGIPFVGCKYGFGDERELEGADALAERPGDIPEIIKKLTKKEQAEK